MAAKFRSAVGCLPMKVGNDVTHHGFKLIDMLKCELDLMNHLYHGSTLQSQDSSDVAHCEIDSCVYLKFD